MHKKHTALAAIAALMVSTPAYATDYITLVGGQYNALRSEQNPVLYGLEYRFEPWKYNFRPIIGAFGTGDSSFYGYAGFNWEVALLPDQLYLIPNFAVGAYEEGSGKDLGGTLEFRSGIELAYQFPNTHQLGIALNHLSNASIYDKNPGEENIIVTYSIPTSTVLGALR